MLSRCLLTGEQTELSSQHRVQGTAHSGCLISAGDSSTEQARQSHPVARPYPQARSHTDNHRLPSYTARLAPTRSRAGPPRQRVSWCGGGSTLSPTHPSCSKVPSGAIILRTPYTCKALQSLQATFINIVLKLSCKSRQTLQYQ